MNRLFYYTIAAAVFTALTLCGRAYGQAQTIMKAPYDKLHLSAQQSRQIASLESDWNNHYSQLQPRMMTLQKHLESLLGAAKADPIEVTATQEHINQIREQLGVYATATYLRKRRLLNDQQRQQLDTWMRRMYTSRASGGHF